MAFRRLVGTKNKNCGALAQFCPKLDNDIIAETRVSRKKDNSHDLMDSPLQLLFAL
jgi:hypothetical protein